MLSDWIIPLTLYYIQRLIIRYSKSISYSKSPCVLACSSTHASVGINQDLLERLQLPVPNQERSSYSLVLVERLIRVMSQAAQPGDMHAKVPFHFGQFITMHILVANLDIFFMCVCVYRKQSATGYPGAELPFIKAVSAIWNPLYNQGCSSGLSGGQQTCKPTAIHTFRHKSRVRGSYDRAVQ